MSRDQKYLSDRYEKILDLAEHVDDNMVTKIERCLSSIEDRALNYIKQEQSFFREAKNNPLLLYFGVDDTQLELELAQCKRDNSLVLRKLSMTPLNRETLNYLNSPNDDDRSLRLIHFTTTNSIHDPVFQMRVTQHEDGSYNLSGIGTNNVLRFEYLLDLSYINNKYVLSSTKLISTVEQYSKEIEMSEMDLVDYTSPMGSVNQTITPDDLNGNTERFKITTDLSDLSEEEIQKLIDGLTDFFE